ncbi:filamentous hemagglutinin N-terminal domain-containing protein [Nostoc sp. FACHB-110]|uniref:two-partner secretion domain-containing protein n=1 Tax=Nostoc sp. FACHB-110 TaxID=2692834 RepID=UPI0016874D2E|nr:filamentous hemagglutinin N-terminal domain-containing protein [Nostoc sp. FACHB-110]MBD2436521.1 filamentous hemagglutinin N-terminal domain-containing protein [Nostoc sp. FACHB-110]
MSPKRINYAWQLGLVNTLILGLSVIGFKSVYAQSTIIPDGTLGSENSLISPVVNSVQNITGGAQRNNNLFHSFQEFNVSDGQSVFFISPDNIQNIVARVTGNNASQILGILGTRQVGNSNSVAAANLLLINPHGIVFGPNAELNIGSSFLGSTASAIKLADGTLFSATAPQSLPLLTVSTPIGLQFGATTAGDILFQGSFIEIPLGKTLALVGGNVTLDQGTILIAESGQIALGGVKQEANIDFNLNSNNQALSFPNHIPLADISLKDMSIADVSVSDLTSNNSSGQIQVQGRQVSLTSGSRLTASTAAKTDRGISITAEGLTVEGGSRIETFTLGEGNGGNITINTSDFVRVSGTDLDGISSSLRAETLALAQGAAGNLTIDTSKLIVEEGATITTSTFGTSESGQNSGGNLTVNASDFVKVSGMSLPTGLFTQTLGTGNAGSISINTGRLIVQNGLVTAGTGNQSQGNGGTLTVRASDSVELSGIGINSQSSSGLFARSRGSGNAGSLNIFTDNLTVRDNAIITVESLGSGNAGNLNIQARSVRLANQGKITAETTSGKGGNIALQNLDLLLLQGNSQITTNADTARVGADVAGGNIDIDSKLIVATPGSNSDITANAFRGRGGNIKITTDGLFNIAPRDRLTPQNDITAASEIGINGTVQINTPDVQPSKGIVALPEEVFDASQAIAKACSNINDDQRSEIAVTGRGGLPPSPDEPLSSEIIWSDTRLNSISSQTHSSNQRFPQLPSAPQTLEIVPAAGWVFNQQGEVTLIPQVANATINTLNSNSNGCLQHKSGT